jgi:hypothetical protein
LPSLDTDELRVREETLKKLHADAERYLAEYTRLFGNVLNADDAASLFEEYNQNRAKYREAVHPAATWIRDELFRRALAEKARWRAKIALCSPPEETPRAKVPGWRYPASPDGPTWYSIRLSATLSTPKT